MLKIKRKIVTFLVVFSIFLMPTAAFASLFYDLSGVTSISSRPVGVRVISYSSTTDVVDEILVGTDIWLYGDYLGWYAYKAYDSDFISGSKDLGYSGYYYAESRHTAYDWTGDEYTESSASYWR
ncbi:MAG: hypothetical protein ACOY4Q_12285 [Bacillota bacterium]